ncbi:MAG: nucleoside deaminase [Candidatus Omnitrophica bacterium]|nr:nucleoside deaminase [Candidatus Omnitrophota bacterium]
MNKWMAEAVREAFSGMRKNEGGPFGALIVKDGKVVSKAHNRVLKTNDPAAHAEILAIRKASKRLGRFDLSDCEIYSTCEPCPMCMAAILWARIKKLCYGCTKKDAEKTGFDDRRFYNVINIKNDKKLLVKKQIDRKSCLAPFREWDKKPDKIIY